MKKCPFCAEDIQEAAIKCRYCGSQLNAAPREPTASSADSLQAVALPSATVTVPQAARKTSGPVQIAAIILGLLLLLSISNLFNPDQSSSTAHVSQSDTTSSIEAKARDLYEPLLRKNLAADENCGVTRMLYQGMQKKDGKFFWSVACRSGKSMMIMVDGVTGESRYLDCGVASVVGVKCFELLK